MERTIDFPGAMPTWPAIRQALSAAGHAVQMRMIDNMPAFPDEDPEADWTDLRVSLGAGMVTVRRGVNRLSVVVWGNADAHLLRDQEAIVEACKTAEIGSM